MNASGSYTQVLSQFRQINYCVISLIILASSASASANPAGGEGAAQAGLTHCAGITDSLKRLMCFDQLAVDVAQANHSSPTAAPIPPQPAVPPNATQAPPAPAVATPAPPATNNSVFADPVEPKSINVQLIEARRSARDYWILTFDNGQVWRQNDSRRRAIRGLPIDATISESVLGSYTLKIAGQRWSMKVRRLR